MIKLYPEEKIILLKRRHWLVLALQLLALAGSLTAFALLVFLAARLTSIWADPALRAAIIFLSVFFTQLIWTIFFIVFADYWLDAWIVTTERVIDIEQKGLFNREFSEFKLARLQDVTVDVKGVLATFFRFGDVHVQTAGEAREFVFEQVPNPHEIKNKIMAAYDAYLKKPQGRSFVKNRPS